MATPAELLLRINEFLAGPDEIDLAILENCQQGLMRISGMDGNELMFSLTEAGRRHVEGMVESATADQCAYWENLLAENARENRELAKKSTSPWLRAWYLGQAEAYQRCRKRLKNRE